MEQEKVNQTKIDQAKRRIHQSLDKKQSPSPADVEIIGGKVALEDLLSYRQETISQIKEVVGETATNPIKLNSQQDTPSSSKEDDKPKKQTKAEKDYYEFVDHRLGPLMTLVLFLFVRNWEKAAFYALSETESHELAGPMSNIGPRIEKLLKAPTWAHDLVTASDDVVTILFVMAGYLDRIGALDVLLPMGKKEKKVVEKSEPTIDTSKVQNGKFVDIRNIPGFGSQLYADT